MNLRLSFDSSNSMRPSLENQIDSMSHFSDEIRDQMDIVQNKEGKIKKLINFKIKELIFQKLKEFLNLDHQNVQIQLHY